jgi:hypothetical protein
LGVFPARNSTSNKYEQFFRALPLWLLRYIASPTQQLNPVP